MNTSLCMTTDFVCSSVTFKLNNVLYYLFLSLSCRWLLWIVCGAKANLYNHSLHNSSFPIFMSRSCDPISIYHPITIRCIFALKCKTKLMMAISGLISFPLFNEKYYKVLYTLLTIC